MLNYTTLIHEFKTKYKSLATGCPNKQTDGWISFFGQSEKIPNFQILSKITQYKLANF